jgi:hypothetical protein
MPRITIQQFRALLAGRADTNAAVRGYRELACRPEVAGGMLHSEWNVWTTATAPAAAA